jgi:hypothetical protein
MFVATCSSPPTTRRMVSALMLLPAYYESHTSVCTNFFSSSLHLHLLTQRAWLLTPSLLLFNLSPDSLQVFPFPFFGHIHVAACSFDPPHLIPYSHAFFRLFAFMPCAIVSTLLTSPIAARAHRTASHWRALCSSTIMGHCK